MSHVGEVRLMRNGMNACVITENGTRDITIQFENGTVREHVSYNNFHRGNVAEFPVTRKDLSEYVGMKRRMGNGMEAEVTKAENYGCITIRFENGVENTTSVDRFLSGKAGFPRSYQRDRHVGERVKQSCGLTATLKVYINKADVTAVLSDGTECKHITYDAFIHGHLRPRKEVKRTDRIGESYPQKNGHIFTITAYESATDISGVFDTGQARTHIAFKEIKNGDLCLSARNAWKETYLHAEFAQACGLTIVVEEIVSSSCIHIRFKETGEELTVSKKQIDAGNCLPKGLSLRTRSQYDFCGFHIFGTPFQIDRQVFYHAKALEGGREYLLTAPMMIEFSNERKLASREAENEEAELELD